MIYLICFSISAIFAFLADRAKRRNAFILCSILSVFITTALAGFRDLSVGIDTINYYYGSWSTAIRSDSLLDFLQYFFLRSSYRMEVIYALLIGGTAKLTGDYHVYLFLVHLVIVGGVYIGAFRMREYANPALTLLLFYLLYYNYTLNVSRQYMAIAVIFMAEADLIKNRHIKYIIHVIVASLIHVTAVLGFLPLILYRVIYPRKRLERTSLSRRVLICVGITAFVFLFTPLVQMLVDRGILNRHFLWYLSDEQNAIPKVVISMLLLEVILFVISWKPFRERFKQADFFQLISVLFLILYQLALFVTYGKRIAANLSLMNIVTLGMMVRCHNKIGNRRIISVLVVLSALAYWLYFFGYQNANRTMPYVFGI